MTYIHSMYGCMCHSATMDLVQISVSNMPIY